MTLRRMPSAHKAAASDYTCSSPFPSPFSCALRPMTAAMAGPGSIRPQCNHSPLTPRSRDRHLSSSSPTADNEQGLRKMTFELTGCSLGIEYYLRCGTTSHSSAHTSASAFSASLLSEVPRALAVREWHRRDIRASMISTVYTQMALTSCLK